MRQNEKHNGIRLLKIWEILQTETDEEHPMDTETLRQRLATYGIDAHRITVYEDIRLLNKYGHEVMTRRGRSNQYYVMDRSFSVPELHILLDAVQSASFITEKKTADLVDRIAALAGSQRGALLKQNTVRFNTVKSTNENIYYSVNEILTAIQNRQKIIFFYFDHNNRHERVYRREGHHYVVSPFATVFADGHYYLVIYDKRYDKMANYRIDRMEHVEIIEETADMPPDKAAFDLAVYKKQLFGMFSGENTAVTMEIHPFLTDVVFDLFGEKTRLSDRNGWLRFTVDVQLSDLFLGWCCSFGDKVRLVGPENVRERLGEYLKMLNTLYGTNGENP